MKVYLDNSATTAVDDKVLEATMPYFSQNFGNASSIHEYGQTARIAVEDARKKVAKALNAKNANEVYFTSGGTEADNWAIRGAAYQGLAKGKNHIITSKIEHHAVLHVCEELEKEGFEVTYIDVDEYGMVTPIDIENAITEKTILVSIMAANNEVGTVMPIEQIGKITKEHGVLFHTDAVQAIGAIEIDVHKQNIDLLSLSGHKIHALKGVGALYIRTGVRLTNFMVGGAQERGRRAGTENVAGIVSLGYAIEIATRDIVSNTAKISALRDKLLNGIMQNIPFCKILGHPTKRLANNVNVSIRFIEGEGILLRMDMAKIAASSGSACTSGSLDPSHVLLAMGMDHETAHGSVRFTLSKYTTEEEIDYVIKELPPMIQFLRDMSPLFAQEKGEKIFV